VRLSFAARARGDLARLWTFNVERSEHWALKVQRRLEERAEQLLVAPYAGRTITRAGVRRVSLPDIQYVIDYRLTGELVEIIRIQSTREIR
jgi:plasmid stabilization system protein ParE